MSAVETGAGKGIVSSTRLLVKVVFITDYNSSCKVLCTQGMRMTCIEAQHKNKWRQLGYGDSL
jgi:hypothetical protein